jgi:hypothetical protein
MKRQLVEYCLSAFADLCVFARNNSNKRPFRAKAQRSAKALRDHHRDSLICAVLLESASRQQVQDGMLQQWTFFVGCTR